MEYWGHHPRCDAGLSRELWSDASELPRCAAVGRKITCPTNALFEGMEMPPYVLAASGINATKYLDYNELENTCYS